MGGCRRYHLDVYKRQAKNRDGMADELAFDYAAIAQVIPVPGGASPEPAPPVQQFGTPVETPAPFAATPAANKPVDSAHKLEDQLAQAGVPDKLRPLMVSMNVTPDELQAVDVYKRQLLYYFPLRLSPKSDALAVDGDFLLVQAVRPLIDFLLRQLKKASL